MKMVNCQTIWSMKVAEIAVLWLYVNICCLSNHVVPLADGYSYGCRIQQDMITHQQRIQMKPNVVFGVLLLEKPGPSLRMMMMFPSNMKLLKGEDNSCLTLKQKAR